MLQGSIMLHGKTVLVAGGVAGTGFRIAGDLARLGAFIYVTGRDGGKGREAEQRLRALAGHDGVHFLLADTSTVGGNQQLAERVIAETDRLHVLVNSPGAAFKTREETRDGYEATLAHSAIAPFALAQALRPSLARGAPSRILNVISGSHAMWNGDPFADVQSDVHYVGALAHSRASFLALLWTLELGRRVRSSGIHATATTPRLAWRATARDRTSVEVTHPMPIWGATDSAARQRAWTLLDSLVDRAPTARILDEAWLRVAGREWA